jgi:hypothetical protein
VASARSAYFRVAETYVRVRFDDKTTIPHLSWQICGFGTARSGTYRVQEAGVCA